MRQLLTALALTVTLAATGCSTVCDVALDMALETREERQVRHDRARARDGEPMHHHQDWADLDAHQRDLERRAAE